MSEGVVVGGWGFVWAAYALTFGAFVVYGTMPFLRVREERRRAAAPREHGAAE